jgi:hypothetical protein
MSRCPLIFSVEHVRPVKGTKSSIAGDDTFEMRRSLKLEMRVQQEKKATMKRSRKPKRASLTLRTRRQSVMKRNLVNDRETNQMC